MYNLSFGHHPTNYRYKDTLIFVHQEYAPIDINEGGYQERHGKNPRRGVAEANGNEAEGRNSQQTDQDAGNHFGDARKHRQIGVSRPLNGVAKNAKQPQHREERDGYMQEEFRIIQDFPLRGFHKKQRKRAGPSISTQKVNAQ